MSDTYDSAEALEPDDEPHFLADPDVAGAFDLMLDEFARETDRGSILIAADIVSDHLENLIRALAPASFPEPRLKSLLNYPGAVASFAARADVAYLAGFIGETAHTAIGSLRGLRNKAAHSRGAFSLADHRDTLRAICELGPGTALAVNRLALDLIMQSVVQSLLARGIEMAEEFGSNPFASPSEIIDHLSARPDAMAAMEGRLPRMELAFGVFLLLGLMNRQTKDLLAARSSARSLRDAPNVEHQAE